MTISAPASAFTEGPHVSWKHIDGPFMTWAGHCHWLTYRERFVIWAGLRTVDEVACKRWPYLAKTRQKLLAAGDCHLSTLKGETDA